MKKNIFIMISLLFASSISVASGTFCSGFSVHYVSQRMDFGTPPPQGQKLGEDFLSLNGSLKAKIEYIADLPSIGSFDLSVKIENEDILKSEDFNGVAGYKVYRATLTVQERAITTVSESVICQTSWAFVP